MLFVALGDRTGGGDMDAEEAGGGMGTGSEEGEEDDGREERMGLVGEGALSE